jgi:flagellar hook-basal body complex protein FliE
MSMALSLLNKVAGTFAPITSPLSVPTAKGGEFGSMFASAVQQVNQLQTDSASSIQRFLTGQGEELHNVALATQRAELSLDMGIQVRNKVVSAYQEIMKMQL